MQSRDAASLARGRCCSTARRLYLAGGNTVSPGIFDLATGQCTNAAPSSPGAAAPRGRELHLAGGQVKVVGQPLYSRPEAPVFDPALRPADPVVTVANARLTFAVRRGEQGRSHMLTAHRIPDGEKLWDQPLPAEPIRWGVAVSAEGRILIALRGGRILCYGQQ